MAWLGREVRNGERTAAFDVRVSEALVGVRSEGLTRTMKAVTLLGDHRFLLVATPAVVLVLWIGKRHVSSLLFAGSVLGGLGLSSILKIAVARARPDRWAALVTETTYSYPSGHTLMATVFFGGLAAVVFHMTTGRAARGAAVVAAGIVIVAVAASRVYLAAHWATDTLAGIMAGLIWVFFYAATTESVTRLRDAAARSRGA